MKSVSELINQNKINLFLRLMGNTCTSKLILNQLENHSSNTFTSHVMKLCSYYKVNFFDLLLNAKKLKLPNEQELLPNDTRHIIATAFKFWETKEQRQIFRNLLEQQIPR